MTSCTEEESMTKLCNMMGYNMHYYKSAVVDVGFMYTGPELSEETELAGSDSYIDIPQFTAITDESGEVNFITTKPVKLTYRYETKSIPCIEGSLVDFQINTDNIVRLGNLDDNLRIYFPETQIAQNGIWIFNAENLSETWEPVNNLNTALPKTRVWKFGYDSRKKLPYIQFPKDINEILNEGIKIKYLRTLGINGNISAKKLTKLSGQTTLKKYNSYGESTDIQINVDGDNYLTIQNPSSCLNGENSETIDEAYEGFKKTIGTFDTLTTCRDYANAIYNLTMSEHDSSNLVSNVQVSDIRDDINKCNKIVTFNDYGLAYEDVSEYAVDGVKDAISHFDLYLYPLNPLKDSYTAKTYQNSFKPNTQYWNDIITDLTDYKTIAHNIVHVNTDSNSNDIYLIKNYYKLGATIATTYKVGKYEGRQILTNVYNALYKKFNARNLDYGVEISYDSILSCIEQADARIKNVSLNEPTIEPRYMLGNGLEYKLTNDNIAKVPKRKHKTICDIITKYMNAIFYDILSITEVCGKSVTAKSEKDILIQFDLILLYHHFLNKIDPAYAYHIHN